MTKIVAETKKAKEGTPPDPGLIHQQIPGSEVVAGNVLLGNQYLFWEGQITPAGQKWLDDAGLTPPIVPPPTLPPPEVASLAPTSGVDGAEVVITGTYFQPQGEHSQVKIGTENAAIVSWTETEVVVAALQGQSVFDAPLAVWLRPNDKQDVNAGAFTFVMPEGDVGAQKAGKQGELDFDLEGVPGKKGHK